MQERSKRADYLLAGPLAIQTTQLGQPTPVQGGAMADRKR